MKKWIAAASAAVLLSGCQNAYIAIKEDGVVLHTPRCEPGLVQGTGKMERHNLPPLYFRSVTLGPGDRPLVYGRLTLEAGYRFHNGLKRTVDLLFEPLAIEEVASAGNLSLFRLESRNGSPYGVLAYNGNRKEIRLLYPLDDESLSRLEEALRGKECGSFEYQWRGAFEKEEAEKLFVPDHGDLITGNLLERAGGRPATP
jgi:hypothetical protein